MAVKVTPQQFVTNWTTGVTTKGANYKAGVQGSGDWAGPTVAALPQAVQGVIDAFNSGRTAAAINNMGTATWRNITVAKAQNWQTGVTSQIAIQNMTAGAQTLINMLNTALGVVDSMPRGTLQQNLARSNALATSLYNQKRGL